MWRAPNLDDIASTLSQAELDAFRRSEPESGADPVLRLLARSAEAARGYCRANPALTLSPEPGTVPEPLVSAVCDHAAYDILKRLPVPMKEPRQRARDEALAVFRDIAAGRLTPESYTPPGAPEPPPPPRQTPAFDIPQRIL